MINWIDKESREYCHVNHCDVDPLVGVDIVLVVYFGGENSYDELLYSVEDFFQKYEPEGFHS